jgi:hypothetical protein
MNTNHSLDDVQRRTAELQQQMTRHPMMRPRDPWPMSSIACSTGPRT